MPKNFSNLLGILLGVVLIGFFVSESCRPKNDDTNPISVDSTALSSCILMSERINDALLKTYEYDSLRRLTRVFEYGGIPQSNRLLKRYSFVYDSKSRILQFRETNLAVRDQNFIYNLTYNNKNILEAIEVQRVYNSGARSEDTLFVKYDPNNRLTELSSRRGVSSKWEYDTEGNAVKWFVKTPLMQADSLAAEYGNFDDKVNIYAFSQGIQLVNLLTGRAPSRRNPLNYTTSGQSVEASYQYNLKRVPTLAVLKYKTSNNTLRETVYSYELSCK
ncbi:MAG: hypothetical protein ACK41O_16875 [Runella zeae]